MSLGVILMSLMSLCVFCVCLLHLEMRLVSLEMIVMSLGVGLEQELEHEFGVDFDEFDEFVRAFVAFGDAFDEFGDAFDEFGRGFGTGAWR